MRALVLSLFSLLLLACESGESTPPPVAGGGGGEPSCDPNALLVDGACVNIGVPPSDCGEGFEADDKGGCTARLPAEPCPPGFVALPGETSCRELSPCGSGSWGDIITDSATQFVDQSFTGTSDGTQQQPWADISSAIAAAAPGATIAIAEGSYAASLAIDKPLTLWGRCPSLVHISGQFAISVTVAQSTTVIRGVSVSASGTAIGVFRAADLLIDRVWLHDTGGIALGIQDDAGDSVVTLTDSLIEGAHDLGIIVAGATLTMDRSIVRDTLPRTSDGSFGGAIEVLPGFDSMAPAQLTLRRSVLERNHDVALSVFSTDATVEDALFRYTVEASSKKFGRAVDVESNPLFGVRRASLVVRRSVFHDSHDVGLFAAGADVTLESTVVASTQPQVLDDHFGRAVQIQDRPENVQRGQATLSGCLLASGYDAGLVVANSDVTVERSWIRDFRRRQADELFGDGVALVRHEPTQMFAAEPHASLTMDTSLVQSNGRAGLANFGGTLRLKSSVLECNDIDINGEPDDAAEPQFDDQGANACRCGDDIRECRSLTAGLAPPEPIPD